MSYGERYPQAPWWRIAWRVVFGAFLVVAFVGGTWAALQPTLGGPGEPGVEVSETEPSEAASVAPGPGATEAQPSQGDRPTAEEFIAAADPPEETTVQVLDAGGGGDATADAAEVLGVLGYDVVAVNDAGSTPERTTVQFTRGERPQARGLRARDRRFRVIERNTELSEDVDLHVLVAADWQS